MSRNEMIAKWAAGYVNEFNSLPNGDAAGFFLRLSFEAFMAEDATERLVCQLATMTIEAESV